MALVQAAKKTLRQQIENKLMVLSTEEKKIQTELVLKKLFSLPEFAKSKRISVYLSTDKEVSTEAIVREIFKHKKQCYVPRYSQSVMEMVKLNSMDDWERLPLTKWKIKQPNLTDPRENAISSGGLDLIIVPGVAFTPDGERLGHGRGYYDTFLSSLQQHQTAPVTIALAFKEQIVEDIPTQPHDVPINYVLYNE